MISTKYQRGGYFDSFYVSVTDIVDTFSLPSQGSSASLSYKQQNDLRRRDNMFSKECEPFHAIPNLLYLFGTISEFRLGAIFDDVRLWERM